MLKSVLKFLGMGLGIAVMGVLLLLVVQYFRYRNSPEYQVTQNLKNLEKQYAEDPYGGDTPEETLRLFVDALKTGDTELAAKYFVLDKQQEWREDLAKIEEKGLLDEMVRDLEKATLKINDDAAFYTLLRDDGFESQLVMHKSSLNGKWKITEL